MLFKIDESMFNLPLSALSIITPSIVEEIKLSVPIFLAFALFKLVENISTVPALSTIYEFVKLFKVILLKPSVCPDFTVTPSCPFPSIAKPLP